ncbi:hypothetical protein [Nitrincola alkalilacustris]|uniref:hypothetical protein n=1 Tax=Nitrincola alkalilacustris TaxID=1571224 RepID=UPI00124E0EB6|nr:hypothetical protein [Nitrincola alkalilacustris]
MHNALEQQRHQYLDAMGIASWLPRVDLPGAAPSADWVFAFRTGQVAIEALEAAGESAFDADSPVEVDHTTGQNALRQLAGLAAGAGSDKASRPDKQLKPATTPVVQEEILKTPLPSSQVQDAVVADPPSSTSPANNRVQPPPRFRLAFIKAGDMLVVDALPPHARQGFSPLHQRLLQRIVQALNVSDQQGLPQFLSWPMLASKTLNQGPDEARRSVERLLGYQLTPEISRVLLLGEPAARWVLARDEPLDQLRGLSFTLKPGVKVVASHSLSELLQLPEYKADLWRDLQPLHQAATSSER